MLASGELAENLKRACLEEAQQKMEKIGGIDVRIAALMGEITALPAEGSAPGAYITAHREAYEELLSYDSAALQYCFAEFLSGAQTDLRGLIMAQLCQDIMPRLGEGFLIDWEPADGQAWFDALLFSAHLRQEELGAEEMGKYYPVSHLLLEMEKEGAAY